MYFLYQCIFYIILSQFYRNCIAFNYNCCSLTFFFARLFNNFRSSYKYAERKAPQIQKDGSAAIFAEKHVRFIPAEGDAKVFRGGLSCAWRTDTARTRLSSLISPSGISSLDTSVPAVSRPRRSRAASMQRVYVLSRVEPSQSFSRLCETYPVYL